MSACARTDERAYCWGSNNVGQVGDGTTTDRLVPTRLVQTWWNAEPAWHPHLLRAGDHSSNCAVTQLADVYCWGYFDGAQNLQTKRTGPAGVADLSGPCYLLTNTTVNCDGSVVNVGAVPLSGATRVVSGYNHRCVLRQDATVMCWGGNVYGQLGGGTYDWDDHPVPTTVPGLSDVVDLASGGETVCALIINGQVKCWGYSEHGEAGTGAIWTGGAVDHDPPRVLTPTRVVGINNAIAISSGEQHTCATLDNGTIKCWGNNAYGELGDGSRTNRATPVVVTGITEASKFVP